MVIRKLFKFEGAHRVYNCSSKRCKYSDHGHSYTVEVFFSAAGLDNGRMVIDFGLTKGYIKDVVDSFDHAYSMWTKMPDEHKTFYKSTSARWIEMPDSPSAEAYSLMLLYIINKLMGAIEFNNGEKNPFVTSVRVHETDTGYAESFIDDLIGCNYELDQFIFSDAVREEWAHPNMLDDMIKFYSHRGTKPFVMPVVEQQI